MRHAFNKCWSPFPAGPGLAAGWSDAGCCIRPPQRDKRTKFEKWKAICQRTLLRVPTEQKWISASLHLTFPPKLKALSCDTRWVVPEIFLYFFLPLSYPTTLFFSFLHFAVFPLYVSPPYYIYTVGHLWYIYHSFHLAPQHLFLVSLQVSALPTFSSFCPSLCSTLFPLFLPLFPSQPLSRVTLTLPAFILSILQSVMCLTGQK